MSLASPELLATETAPERRRAAAPPAVQADAEASVCAAALDAPRTFLGPRADYYDESWRWMDWTGRRRSWNAAAALGFGGWLAYRRMYGPTVPALLWPALAAALIVEGAPLLLVVAAHAGLALLLGFYGNTLYLHHFRRVARTMRERDHAKLLAALAKRGGTDRRAAVGAGVATVVLMLGAAGLTAD